MSAVLRPPMGKDRVTKAPRIPITFPEALYESLREASFRQHVPMSEIVREALREHLLRNEMEVPLPFGNGEGS
ncbi:MAG: ribbon-helix-helix domain-containing protein [Candidatus Dormibacteraeota bacterium]|nr:ribbon-helix-helix domain-containing protein [Candidatus Dormibacteraeota bacterium]